MDDGALEAALAAADEHLDDFVEELQALCRIPSRRWQPEAMEQAATFVAASIRRHGGMADCVPWPESFPYVLGEISGGPARLLHFNHYDVEIEPVGDDDELAYPPFAAEIHDGKLYARGSADDKGALMSRIHAAAAYRLAGVPLPVTVRFIAEGKRWLHSPGLPSFAREHADRLAADGILWENSWIDEDGRPLLKLGEKGLLYIMLHCRRMARAGSSQNAAVLPNAAAELVAALATLHGPDGAWTVPGYETDVRELDDLERRLLQEVPFEVDPLLERMGLAQLTGAATAEEAAYAVRARPTVTLTGFDGGDTRHDVTLNLPATATAKLEIRLVPDQTPERVLDLLRAHLDRAGHGGVDIDVLAATHPHRTPPTDPFVQLVAEAAERTYGRPPVVEPATPLVGNQASLAVAPIVGVGVGRAWAASDTNQHIYLEDYRNGVHHVIRVMAAMGSVA